MTADSVITAIGESGDYSFAPEGLNVEGDDIKIDRFGRTSVAGVFAGGDAALASHTVVDAIGSGKRAAVAIDRRLRGLPEDQPMPRIGEKGSVSISRYLGIGKAHPNTDVKTVVSYSDLNTDYFEHSERRQREFHCGVCNMCDNCYLFCPDVAIAHREKGYGYDLDLDYCKGCGVCVHECPRYAMILKEE